MDLNKLKESKNSLRDKSVSEKKTQKGIAIIGISANIGGTGNLEGFWDAVKKEQDLVRSFPENRWEDANQLKLLRDNEELSDKMGQSAYLDSIDQFDPGFFHIAKTEADIMDPAQRLFLETAWASLEDAGYSNTALNKSKTGVYVGYSSQGGQYSQAIEKNADNFGISVSGNLNSIIASRLSYCFNLTGPAVVVDTACSSSLTALHLACSQIKSGEIDMAVVGSVSITLVPRDTQGEKMGIESSSERTKTFDDTADGTGGGEGVISIVVKSLARALEDRDHIYAVIKGSAMNQDGASMGITAPNAAQQEAVIHDAWKAAQIDPLTISYMEAHGTGTSLGDPVEITGVESAFRKYTDRRQFCGIGSVKSNIGHLDSAAGLAGLVKTVCMLQKKQMPPTLHFKIPNRKISFIDSPVYVNDTLRDWTSEDGPLRCGISSFGLSGTNVHVVLEEAPDFLADTQKATYKLLTISAKDKTALSQYLKEYQDYIRTHKEICFEDFCYTANKGRSDFECRFAVILEKPEDLIGLTLDSADSQNVFYGQYIMTDEEEGEGYLTEQKKQVLSNKIEELAKQKEHTRQDLKAMAALYIQGGIINWDSFYQKNPGRTIRIPTYPYQHKRCWIPETKNQKQGTKIRQNKKKLHPLIDQCLADAYRVKIYQVEMTMAQNWELSEHRVNGKGVLPGTAFIEMAQFVGMDYFKEDSFQVKDLIYLKPLACGEKNKVVVQVKLEEKENHVELGFYSKIEEDGFLDKDWSCNAEMKLERHERQEEFQVPVADIMNRMEKVKPEISRDFAIVEIIGNHWSDNLQGIYASENELVLDLYMSEEIWEESKQYYMIPSVLDQAISSGNFFSKSVYMPYCFKQGYFQRPLPRHFYSYIKKQENPDAGDELALFDIYLCDENGQCFAQVNDYALKKVHQPEFFLVGDQLGQDVFSTVEWEEADSRDEVEELELGEEEYLLVLYQDDPVQRNLVNEIRVRYRFKAILVELVGSGFIKKTETEYAVGQEQEDYDKLFASLEGKEISRILHLAAYRKTQPKSSEELNQDIDRLLRSSFCTVNAILHNYIRYNIHMLLVSQNGVIVTGSEEAVYALNHAITGFGMSVHDEYQNITINALDCGENVKLSVLLKEINRPDKTYATAYRDGRYYTQKMRTLPYSQDISEKDLGLKENGVYIITGGMGGMGLAFTRYLIGLEPTIRIKLLNRSYSDQELNAGNVPMDEMLSQKLKTIEELRNRNASIEIIKADVTKYGQLEKTLETIRETEGSIDGIIHTAGVAADGFIMNKDWDGFMKTLDPKIVGAWNLLQLVKEDKLDFFVMCSSLASVYGSPGQIDYVTANAFLDSFAHQLRLQGIKALTINWTGWKESGMAINHQVDEAKSLFQFMKDDEGAVSMAFAVKTGLPRVLIGKLNYGAYAMQREMLEGKIKLPDDWEEKMKGMGIVSQIEVNLSDIVITGKSMEQLTQVEKDLILCWARVLGVREIDMHDKFFEAGGNSLLAANFQKEIEKKYPGCLSISDIFSCSTVEKIAEFIDSQVNKSAKKLTIEELVKEEPEEEDDLDIEQLVEQLSEGKITLDLVDDLLNGK